MHVTSTAEDADPFETVISRLNTPERFDQLQTSNQVIASAKEILSSCPTRDYVIVSQPNVHAADIRDGSHCKMRSLCDTIASKEIKGRFSVAEVVGDLSTHSLEDYVKEACAAKGKVAGIVKVDLTHLPSLEHKDKRAQILASNGMFSSDHGTAIELPRTNLSNRRRSAGPDARYP